MLRGMFDGLSVLFQKEMKDSEKSAEGTVIESELKKYDLADGKKPDTSKAELDLKCLTLEEMISMEFLMADTPHNTQMLQLCFRAMLPPGQKEQRVQPGRLLTLQCSQESALEVLGQIEFLCVE